MYTDGARDRGLICEVPIGAGAPSVTPADVTPASLVRETLVVVGNGMVGYQVCKRLTESGGLERYRVVVFGEEPVPAYDRVHLTDVLAGRDEASLAMAPASWYEAVGIDLRTGDPVVGIDRQTCVVHAASGARVRYDRLVLATGSTPMVPDVEGVRLSGVFVYRTIDDLRRIQVHAAGVRSAAVLGGGLLGLEAARALQHLGLDVSVVELAPALMAAQLDNQGAAILAERVAALGLRIRTGTMTSRIEADGTSCRLCFADGDVLTVGLVVIAVGIRPRSELAIGCGLEIGAAGAIAVDDGLTTSDPRIHAVGECASHRFRRYGLVAPGYEMADVLVSNLTGGRAAFAGSDGSTRLKLLGVDVATVGDPLDAGNASRFTRDGTYRMLRVERGRLVGALGVGPWPELSRIQTATLSGRRIWPWQAMRFERTGRLWSAPDDIPVTEWPASAVVCNCRAVTCGQLSLACAAGGTTVEALGRRTGAGTLCGSCVPLLEEWAGQRAPVARPRVQRALLGASVAALLASLAILLSPALPYATSVAVVDPLDAMWRNGLYRQLSGYALLSISALATLLSARKRWSRVSIGSFVTWRAVHTVIGVLSLVGLAAHTGMRLGHHLNLVLMGAFVALNLAGVAAGALTAIEGRLSPRAGRALRSATVFVHVLGVWPLPVLVLFHVLTVYYF